jgi:glycosyltransferase involved in cell wall biosynthesis
LGSDRFGDLPYILKTLRAEGLTQEATVTEAIYSQTDEGDRQKSCRELLEKAYYHHQQPQQWEYEIFDDRRPQPTYRASIIVSLYNAAAKLPRFLRTLQHQTLLRSHQAEIILVDSGSPTDEYKVFQALADELQLPILYVRSQQRETIQSAWNRGISLAHSPYLSFLGVDETIVSDCLEVLVDVLDRESSIDWAIGHSLVTQVDREGNWVDDIMLYDRRGYQQDLVYLETCYLSWVGALYRRSIHERFGYYDASFRGAGDTEFKNRVLPHIKSAVVNRTLGLFWNYPDERTTQSPRIELEDMRAWYLHRTVGGIEYALGDRSQEEAEQLLYKSLSYRKSYCQHISSDLDYAYNLCQFIQQRYPNSPALRYFDGIKQLLKAYRSLDWIDPLTQLSPLSTFQQTRQLAQAIAAKHRKQGDRNFQPDYQIFHDNRHEQHSFLWFTEIKS